VSWDLPEPFVYSTHAGAAHIDGYGHVNNAVYVGWLDDCAWAHSTALGLSLEDCRTLRCGMVVWRTQIHYLAAALEGDDIEVATWIMSNDGRLRIDRRFQMRRVRDASTLLRARIRYVSVDLGTGRARRMPRQFTERYTARTLPPDELAAFQPGLDSD
jgi:acyl-CoA thioester hydrolase